MKIYSKENHDKANAFIFVSGSYNSGFFNIFVAFSGPFNVQEVAKKLPIEGAVILFYKRASKIMYEQNMIGE